MLAASVTQVMTGRTAPSSPVVMVAVVLDGHGAVRGPHPAHARSTTITPLKFTIFLRLDGPFFSLFGPFWALFGLSSTLLRPPKTLHNHAFSRHIERSFTLRHSFTSQVTSSPFSPRWTATVKLFVLFLHLQCGRLRCRERRAAGPRARAIFPHCAPSLLPRMVHLLRTFAFDATPTR